MESKNIELSLGQLLALAVGDPPSPSVAALSDDVFRGTQRARISICRWINSPSQATIIQDARRR